jgi:hypothetical protein
VGNHGSAGAVQDHGLLFLTDHAGQQGLDVFDLLALSMGAEIILGHILAEPGNKLFSRIVELPFHLFAQRRRVRLHVFHHCVLRGLIARSHYLSIFCAWVEGPRQENKKIIPTSPNTL